MKIRIDFNGIPHLKIIWEGDEWNRVETVLQSLNLERRKTTNAWGCGMEAEFYRDTREELRMIFQRSVTSNAALRDKDVCDDVNQPFLPVTQSEQQFNIAIFRIIPKDGVTVVPIAKYITIKEFCDITKLLGECYNFIANIAMKKEITINGV